MRKAALLCNPDSGGNVARRLRELQSSLEVLRNGGVEADLILAESRDQAQEQVRQAIASGCDTIFACGGDGTIHNVAQVLANSAVALAILPMGTANALAHDIGLPLSVVGAAQAALCAVARRVALGHVTYVDLQGASDARYFVITAGVGVDAHLFYKLQTGTKKRMGMAAYYAKAWNLWFTYPMTRFVAEYLETGSDAPKHADVTELMSIRIRNFGGVLQELAPGASLDREDMRVVLCRTSSRLSYLAYVTRGLLRQRWRIPGIDLAYSTKVSCGYLSSSSAPPEQRKIYIEADGELLGMLPAEITVVPSALTLLAPAP
jgi:diacylglycerol kinase (ATP)